MKTQVRDISLWQGQLGHFVCLAVLLILSWFSWDQIGRPLPKLFWFAVSVPVMHQVFVWITWRLELKYSFVSRNIGFQLFLIAFFVLFLGRFISLAWLAWADQGSWQISTVVTVFLTVILLVPGLYAMYSVKRYFGLARAAGADHFDIKYRTMPLVRKGIFRFTDNGMYLYAFLLFWAIAVYFSSISALIVAGFSHLYIWVHFYCTEQPDMEYIFGGSGYGASEKV